MQGGDSNNWASVAHELIGLTSPYLKILLLLFVFWVVSRVANEKPGELMRSILAEFTNLAKGKRDLKSMNALVLLVGAFLIVLIFASPFSELLLQVKETSPDYEIVRLGIIALLLMTFFLAGIISVKICRYEDK